MSNFTRFWRVRLQEPPGHADRLALGRAHDLLVVDLLIIDRDDEAVAVLGRDRLAVVDAECRDRRTLGLGRLPAIALAMRLEPVATAAVQLVGLRADAGEGERRERRGLGVGAVPGMLARRPPSRVAGESRAWRSPRSWLAARGRRGLRRPSTRGRGWRTSWPGTRARRWRGSAARGSGRSRLEARPVPRAEGVQDRGPRLVVAGRRPWRAPARARSSPCPGRWGRWHRPSASAVASAQITRAEVMRSLGRFFVSEPATQGHPPFSFWR